MSETGAFTLTETGTLSSIKNETGNTTTGTYARTITGNDGYSMVETGVNLSGNNFGQTITGSESYPETESGNTVSQTYTRGITGSGTLKQRNDGRDHWRYPDHHHNPLRRIIATACPKGLTWSPERFQPIRPLGRYALLVYFVDASNADASTPGNMNFSPVGRPFQDPFDWDKAELAAKCRLAGPWRASSSGRGRDDCRSIHRCRQWKNMAPPPWPAGAR